jgi:hypothetical protein
MTLRSGRIQGWPSSRPKLLRMAIERERRARIVNGRTSVTAELALTLGAALPLDISDHL